MASGHRQQGRRQAFSAASALRPFVFPIIVFSASCKYSPVFANSPPASYEGRTSVQGPIPVISRGKKGKKQQGRRGEKASKQLQRSMNTRCILRENKKSIPPPVLASEVGFYRRGNLEPLVRFAAHSTPPLAVVLLLNRQDVDLHTKTRMWRVISVASRPLTNINYT